MTDYTLEQTFKPGDRVELHPGLDLWARGARFGTIRSRASVNGADCYVVDVDKVRRRLHRIPTDLLRLVRTMIGEIR